MPVQKKSGNLLNAPHNISASINSRDNASSLRQTVLLGFLIDFIRKNECSVDNFVTINVKNTQKAISTFSNIVFNKNFMKFTITDKKVNFVLGIGKKKTLFRVAPFSKKSRAIQNTIA